MSFEPDWLLTPERAAVHVPTATAVLADLHLGYNQARNRRGEAVPMVGVADALRPLGQLRQRLQVARLVIAGDLFEDACCERSAAELLDWLERAGIELAGFIPGNHDRRLDAAGPLRPYCCPAVSLGRWQVVHGDGTLPAGPVVHGHFHPRLRWGRITAPCFLTATESLVLPAFSEDARGVDVLGQSRWSGHRCWALTGTEVLDLGPLTSLRHVLLQVDRR